MTLLSLFHVGVTAANGEHMTSASDVHLFAWMKENWTILGSFIIVIWAMMIFWFRTIMEKFHTRKEINELIDTKIALCKQVVDVADERILTEVGKVAAQIEKMDEHQRSDAKEHAEKHEQIIRDMAEMKK